jgi:hypothetical protein
METQDFSPSAQNDRRIADDSSPHPPRPSKPTPSPSPYQGEEHLAVGVLADGAFAACFYSLHRLSHWPLHRCLQDRCIAVR